MKRVSKQRNARFIADCMAMLRSFGASEVCAELQQFTLDTVAGPLMCRPIAGTSTPWFACQFDDTRKAKESIVGYQVSSPSGKWNFLTDDVGYIRSQLAMIATAPDVKPITSGESLALF